MYCTCNTTAASRATAVGEAIAVPWQDGCLKFQAGASANQTIECEVRRCHSGLRDSYFPPWQQKVWSLSPKWLFCKLGAPCVPIIISLAWSVPEKWKEQPSRPAVKKKFWPDEMGSCILMCFWVRRESHCQEKTTQQAWQLHHNAPRSLVNHSARLRSASRRSKRWAGAHTQHSTAGGHRATTPLGDLQVSHSDLQQLFNRIELKVVATNK